MFVTLCINVSTISAVVAIGDESLVKQVDFVTSADAVNKNKSQVVRLSPIVMYLQAVERW